MTRALRIVICAGAVMGGSGWLGWPGAFGSAAMARHPGHPDHDDRTAPLAADRVDGADSLKNEVSIQIKDGFRVITSNGIPDHATGQFPGRGNPNSIGAQRYTFRVPVSPKAAERPMSIGSTNGRSGPPMLPGIALNGVVFDPGTAEWWNNDRSSGWNYDALSGKINLGVDSSHAHVQPNGAYHYHGVPDGLVDRLLAGKKRGESMVQVGWAADGYPIYAVWGQIKDANGTTTVRELKPSYRLKSGERPGGDSKDGQGPGGAFDGTFVQDFEYAPGSGDLDECNGRTGPTPEFPDGTYYYVITGQFPFVPRMLHGVPDASFQRKGPPSGGPGRRGGPDGPGPGPGGPPDRKENRGDRPPPPRP